MLAFLDAIRNWFPERTELIVVVAAATLLLLFVVQFMIYRSPRPRSTQIQRLSRAKKRPGGSPPSIDPADVTSDGDLHRLYGIMSDLRDDNKVLRKRIAHLSIMNTMLAPLIKELNSTLDRRRLGPLVLRVLQRLFNPAQALVFMREEGGDGMVLVGQCGCVDIEEGFRMGVGQGFAGAVAAKKVLMTARDLRFESNLVREKVERTEPEEFRTEVAAPILHRGNVLGVLCIGGAGQDSPDVETLLGMICDMVAMSLANLLQYRKIQQLANSDPLTGIYNKGFFLENCGSLLTETRKAGLPAALMMFDVDNFKNYNDTCGHLAGDQVLREIADILNREVREGDILARYGGEEFILLMPGVGMTDAMQAAERIRSHVAENKFPHRERQPLGAVTISIGVAGLPENGPGMIELIESADQALYEAKKKGRNRTQSASNRLETDTWSGEEGVEEKEVEDRIPGAFPGSS